MKYNFVFFEVLLLAFVLGSPIWGQSLPTQHEVDSVYDAKCKAGDYITASNYIIDYSKRKFNDGDEEVALDYQLKNCELIEEHVDYFFNNGLTVNQYFNNWIVASLMCKNLGYLDDCISIYLDLKDSMNEYAPDLFIDFTNQ